MKILTMTLLAGLICGCGVTSGRGERRTARLPKTGTQAAEFKAARGVWPKGCGKEMNAFFRFKAQFEHEEGMVPVLKMTGCTAYRIRLNGKFAGYGPARGPEGWFRIDEWPLDAKVGRNEVEIDVSGYNCNTYYFVNQAPFLQAEITEGGKVLAATKQEGGDFTAQRTERVLKTPRYSFQRGWTEAYAIAGNTYPTLELEATAGVKYLKRIAPLPQFPTNGLRAVSRARVTSDGSRKVPGAWFVDGAKPDNPKLLGYAKGELENNLWEKLHQLKYSERSAIAGKTPEKVLLRSGDNVMYDARISDCGFIGMKVKVIEPGALFVTFAELADNGEVASEKMHNYCNAVEWKFEKAGEYEVETFEPYVAHYVSASALSGKMEVSDAHIRGYKNGTAGRAQFKCSDKALEKVFAAAKETFIQNAVDVFTDCPSRERAGWLCDSFFTGRVTAMLCGNSDLEKLFIQNFLLPEKFPDLPEGMLPMCYPSDHPNGNFIPNWAMWFVVELEEYLARSGDREMVDALKPRLVKLVKYLQTFRNEDGLLEKLPRWVFVEWSRANKLTQDVNYPSNMTWAEVLDVMDRLYGMPELAAEAKAVRAKILEQSWNGKWFCDNAVRGKDGKLKLSGECTEVCQYYAFFFKTATPKSHPELWKTLVNDFGPKREKTKAYPEIWPANAFIGNYLRLECLSREGLSKNILDETKGFFLYMAEKTGTLWENAKAGSSCDHGFASHAAVYLYRDVLGVKGIDVRRHRVDLQIPDIGVEWCEGTIPVSASESVTVKWKRGKKPTITWNRK